MKLCYYDESGDDGFPKYSSPIFVLTSIYLDHLDWKEVNREIYNLKKPLKEEYGFPINLEIHFKEFLLDKDPYRNLKLNNKDRLKITHHICTVISSLKVKIVCIMINKKAILKEDFDVLNIALKYSIQRIENDINKNGCGDSRFIMITDEGRVGKMRKTSRAIQKVNYIPSKYSDASYRNEIKLLIEDPLPKDSKESFLIQTADIVSYIVYLYGLSKLNLGDPPNRIKPFVTQSLVLEWLDKLKSRFNLDAATENEYGIKIFPK